MHVLCVCIPIPSCFAHNKRKKSGGKGGRDHLVQWREF